MMPLHEQMHSLDGVIARFWWKYERGGERIDTRYNLLALFASGNCTWGLKSSATNAQQIRLEWRRMAPKVRLSKFNDTCCFVCEKERAHQWHHIVPIAMGGDNRSDNRVPLCVLCHYNLHHPKG